MATQKPTAKQDEKVPVATEAKVETPAQTKPAEPTSEKLEELKKAKSAAMTAAATEQIAGNDKAAEDKFLEVYKIGEDIKRELASIRTHEAELLKKEKEAAIVKLFDDAIAAYDASNKINAGKGSIEEKNAAYHEYQAKREVIVNRLLGSRPAGAVAKTGTSTGTKGATGEVIRQMILENYVDGVTIAQVKNDIIAKGYARGTVGTEATKMKNEGLITY